MGILRDIQNQISRMNPETGKANVSSDEVDQLTAKVTELSLAAQLYGREQLFLDSVTYEQRPARHESIPKAHQGTLSWIFDEGLEHGAKTGHILEWLCNGDSIFWVSGRPGSGKSTFMKFVADHHQTRAALHDWGDKTGTDQVALASHYFWSAGTAIQRSQEGLLRSLLFEIFGQLPELIPMVCPERWCQTQKNYTEKPWTLGELRETIARVAEHKDIRTSFCFFIDGLDEFAGEHSQLCHALLELSRSPRIKVCLASRPWNIFEENFVGQPTIRLHQLTYRDIENYTRIELCSHPMWKSIAVLNPDATRLTAAVADRAHGVFLWVFLVVKQLREGLTNHDTLGDLWRRLHCIPEDLERFFKQILEGVEPFYHIKMAETLLMATTANEPLPGPIYGFHDVGYEVDDYAVKESLDPWGPTELRAFMEPFARRLNSRCKGLLEINAFDRVEFIHRTVRDFLQTGEMTGFLEAKAREKFQPNSSIFQGFVCWIKHSRFTAISDELSRTLEESLSYAADSDLSDDAEDSLDGRLIDELEWYVQSRCRETHMVIQLDNAHSGTARGIFCRCILRSGLCGFSRSRLREVPGYFSGMRSLPLVWAVHLEESDSTLADLTPQRIRLLRLLFHNGMNPNSVYTVNPDRLTTPWLELIDKIFPTQFQEGPFRNPDHSSLLEATRWGLLRVFVDAGADVNMLRGSQPIWVVHFQAALSVTELIEQADQYIQDLNQMLSRAKFEPNTSTFRYQYDAASNLRAHPPKPCRVKGRAIVGEFREMLWNIVSDFVQELSGGRRKVSTFRELSFYSRVIAVALSRSAHPSLPVDDIEPALKEMLPFSILKPVLNALELSKPVSNNLAQPSPKRRRLSDGDDVEFPERKRATGGI